jgi:hypothetical protein
MLLMLWGGEGVAPYILNRGTNIDISGQLNALDILPPEQLPSILQIKCWVGLSCSEYSAEHLFLLL